MGSLIFNEMPLNRRRGSAKQLHSNTSQVELAVINNQTRWLLRQHGTNTGVNYAIRKNTEELRPTKVLDAQRLLSEAIPFPNDLLFTTTLINPLRPHPLLVSKQGVRHDYFEAMFDLMVYDSIYAELKATANTIQTAAQDLVRTREHIQTISVELKGIQFNREQFNTLQQRFNDLQRRHNLQQGQAAKLTSWLTVASAISSIETPEQIADIVRQAEIQEKLLETNWLELNQNLAGYRAYQQYSQRVQQINAELAQLPETPPIGAITRKINDNVAVSKVIEKIQPAVQELEDIQKNLDASPDVYSIKVSDVTPRINVAQDTIRRLTHIASHKNCPTCGTQLDPQFIKTLLDTERGNLARLQQEQKLFEEFQRQNKLRLRRTELTGKLNEVNIPANITVQQLIVRTTKIQQIVTQFNELLRTAERKQELQKSLANITPAHASYNVITEEEVTYAKNLWLETQTVKNRLLNDLKLHEQLAKLGEVQGNVSQTRQRLQALQQQLNREAGLLTNLQQQVFQARDNLVRGKLLYQELTSLRQKIVELEAIAKDTELYDHLLAAYGPKGLRIARVQYLTGVWLDNMNAFVNHIISEPYTFSLDVDINRFVILAERSNKISEISGSLSGSEHGSFIALNALAMLHLLPSHYRSNIIVLDEVERGMDFNTRTLFANEFLPKLAELVPNITVISPLSPQEFSITDAREFRVEKIKGISQLRQLQVA